MSTATAPTKPPVDNKEEGSEKKVAQTHNALEEDDEFEEFPVQGASASSF